MYGVYNENDDEMYLMDKKEVWKYIADANVFQNYTVITNGDTVVLCERTGDTSGTVENKTLQEFFEGFYEDEGILIRPIIKN